MARPPREDDPAAARLRRTRNRLVGAIALIFAALLLMATIYVIGLLRMQPGESGPYNEEARQRLDDAWAEQAGEPNRWDELADLLAEMIELGDMEPDDFQLDEDVVEFTIRFKPRVEWELLLDDSFRPPERVARDAAEGDETAAEVLELENRQHEASVRLTHAAFERARQNEFVERLESVLKSRHLRRTQWATPIYQTPLPEISGAHDASRYLQAEARRSAAEQETDRAIRAALTIMKLGGVIARQGFGIDAGAGLRIQRRGILELARLSPTLTPDQLRHILDTLDQLPEPFDPLLALDLDRFCHLQMVQLLYTDNGSGGGRFVPTAQKDEVNWYNVQNFSDSSWENFRSVLYMRKRPLVDHINAAHEHVSQAGGKPYEERAALLATAPPTPAGRMPFPFNAPTGGLFNLADTQRLRIDLLRTLLAIRLYQHAKGQLPPELQALTPEFLSTVPPDPFAPDLKLTYLLDAEAADGFRLYGIGRDGFDDGGTHALPDGALRGSDPKDEVIWPLPN